jgi:Caspase domain
MIHAHRRFLAFLSLLVTSFIALTATPADAQPAGTRRVAILVGANAAPPGRHALVFAHDDATELAGVLEQVGGFVPSNVTVLLDPHPTEIYAALDLAKREAASAGGDVLFVFYYSGHSDGQTLFPHGEAMALSDLRQRVQDLGARIRIGILDTCRGGSWTQSKGLSVGPPLDVEDLMNVGTEGTALVSSSSGFENAHEASAIRGSFFTHYFVAGLRGAADRVRDGDVTLQEAFDYAREQTVQESARIAETPQHPSFDLALRGRQDIVLAVLSSSTSALQVTAARAAIEIIQLPSGVTVADAPTGQGALRIALAPGRYLLRSVVDGRVFTKEMELHDGETAAVGDGQLEATGDDRLAAKKAIENSPSLDAWGDRAGTRWILHVGAGFGSDAAPNASGFQPTGSTHFANSATVDFSLVWRITERLSLSIPWGVFWYRLGDPGGVEVIPYLGLSMNEWNSVGGFYSGLQGGVSARIWTRPNQWVSLGAGVWSPVLRDPNTNNAGSYAAVGGALGTLGDVLGPYATAGYAWSIRNLVTLNGYVGMNRVYSDVGAPSYRYEAQWVYGGGGLSVRVARQVGIDLGASGSTEVHAHLGYFAGFMGGTTLAF